MNLILASTSTYRRNLLSNYGLKFKALKPTFNEESYKNSSSLKFKDLCIELAYQKALSIHDYHPNSIVIGSDQMALVDNEQLGKAHSIEKAAEQIMKLQGRSHELITSLCVLYKDQIIKKLHTTTLYMKPLTHKQALKYVTHDNTIDCAGSYKLEKSGKSLFSKIDCSDESAIIGLPLMELTETLEELNFPFPFL